MGEVFFLGNRTVTNRLQSSRSMGQSHGVWSTVHNPTDPMFYAEITLENIVVGSRYWVAESADLTNVLATGVAASTTEVLSNVPAYANPMLVEIRVRKATSGTRYLPFVTYGYLVRAGITAYIAQVEDPTT